ncbi:MAG: Na+/H+ antiporter NhaA [Planctomycetes bacterium]|nr:Na+/H+ antiporter NhaA [Planctomycetota bacterium]
MSPSGAALPWLARALRSEAFPGALLVAAAATALMIANSSWSAAWSHLWDAELAVEVGPYALQKPVQHWINDGLMVLFFFFVGLELKHEVLDGGLQSAREASLPIAAAVGGMLAPAALYALVLAAHGDGEAVAGWGIPMATDIAFALGVLALLGDRVPPSLRVFLATLAIVDDLGAVLVIAVFYTDDVHWQLFGAGLALLGLSYALNRLGVRRTWPYVVFGLLIWATFLQSGVHATIAGVALALTVPARRLEETVFADRARALVDEFQLVGDANTR